MKELIDYMKKTYDFDARYGTPNFQICSCTDSFSKRQYETKFADWGIFVKKRKATEQIEASNPPKKRNQLRRDMEEYSDGVVTR